MRRRFAAALAAVVAGLLVAPSIARAEAPAPPVIEVYTMGPGPTLPERFGHAALCVRHPTRPAWDRCYDYGAFDASEPLSLGYRFLRGESVFFVAVRDPELMVRDYIGRDRTIWRQELPLSDEQARRAAAILERDAKPENRYYHYHHYFDNCATRVRDIVDEVTDGALASIADDESEQRTFRDFTREGFAEFPWLLVASDVVLGRAVDVRVDAYERMFLPEFLRRGIDEAFDLRTEVIYQRQDEPFPSRPGPRSPVFLLAGLALLAMVSGTGLWGRGERVALAVVAAPLSLLGLLLWTAAVISPLPEIRYNELLLVFMPTDAALPWLSERRRQIYAMARIAGIFAALAFGLLGAFAQPVAHPAALATSAMVGIVGTPAWRAWWRSR